jgi:lipoprotein-anchoring transpeptidase ErfK/SrfK
VTGGELNKTVAVEPRWSENRVEDFVAEVAEQIDRAPRDATIEPAVTSLDRVHSSAGLELRQDELVAAISDEIGQGSSARVTAETNRIPPSVSTKDLVAQYPHYVTVDKTSNVLRYFRDLKPVAEYPVSVGLPQYPTPTGLFSIANKQVDPDWSVPNSDWAGELAGTVVKGGTAENPLRARWMGITDGVGIHGTTAVANLGGPASHGCIRMSVPDVIELYDAIPTGTPIYIG